VLEVLLAAGAVTDWRTGRLPNVLTLGGLAAALLMSLLPNGIGIADAALGAGAALAVLLPPWLARLTGAGDVKLLAMAGAFLGVPSVFAALLVTMVAGGLFALGFAAARGGIGRVAANAAGLLHIAALAAASGQRPRVRGVASIGKLPYGACAFAGVSACVVGQALAR
jgi:prepilin peptidase CpaA